MAYANGRLPDSALRPIAGGGRLEPKAAAAWNAMAAHIYKVRGIKIAPNGPDSSYRSYERQVWWRNYWCSQGKCENAAVPGTSNHGWGLAVDTDDHALVNQYGAPFGWQKAWSDAPSEAWHFRYQAGHYSGKDPGPDYQATHPGVEKRRKKIARKRPKVRKQGRKWRRIKKAWKKGKHQIKRWRDWIKDHT
jgi:hypothetical protein